MGKRKGSRSLFEVMSSKARRNVRVPDWMSHATDERGDPVHPPPAGEGRPAAAPEERTVPTREPMVGVVDGRLQLNLGYLTCLIVCLGLVVLLAGAYRLGQVTAGTGEEPRDPQETKKPDGSEGANRGGHGTGRQELTIRERTLQRWNRGGTFVVIQGNVLSREDAVEIQKYLHTKGYLPVVYPTDNGRYKVYDTLDTTGWTPSQVREYVDRLEVLGRDQKYKLIHTTDEPWRETVPPSSE